MKYLIATIAVLFLSAVWATPANAQCVNGNCGGQFQLQSGFAFAPTNNVFAFRSFAPVPVPVRSFGVAAIPVQPAFTVGGFNQQFNFGRGFNRGVQLNQGFAPVAGRQTITNFTGPFGGSFTRIRQF